MAAYSAQLKAGSKIMVVDTHKDRLALAEKIGATATIGVVGVFLAKDPGAKDALAKQGQIA